MTKKTLEWVNRMTALGNEAVREAQRENLAKGVPNVYFINGKTVFEMPDGTFQNHFDFKPINKKTEEQG